MLQRCRWCGRFDGTESFQENSDLESRKDRAKPISKTYE